MKVKAAILFAMIVASFIHLEAAVRPVGEFAASPEETAEAGDSGEAVGTGEAETDAILELENREEAPEPDAVSGTPYIAVLSVPGGSGEKEWEKALSEFYDRFEAGSAPAVVGAAAQEGEAPYEPVPFASGRNILFVSPGAGHNIIPFDPACVCDPSGSSASVLASLAAQEHRELALLSLRSALYRYAEDHEFRLPERLEDLAKPYPRNYISRLPDFGVEPAYRPERFRKYAMWASLSEVLSLPDLPESYGFEAPLTISVHLQSFQLALESGPLAIRRYAVGIGKPDSKTPEGTFEAELRVNEPVSAAKLFGTRALSFARGEYAIHGTYDEDSIGRAGTNGCIRLSNGDIEELFALAPLGTTIDIRSGPAPHPAWESVPDRFTLEPGPYETTQRIFRWRG